MTAIPDDRPALITLPEVTGSRRATTIMSEFAQRDGFDVALSELERLIDIWGDLSATRAKKLGLSDLVAQRVKALMSPYMSTPYAMTAEAVGRLAALRKRSTDLNIRDLCFHGNFETLVVAMIMERAACQLGAQKGDAFPNGRRWENPKDEELEEWLMIRHTLGVSFGTTGPVIEATTTKENMRLDMENNSSRIWLRLLLRGPQLLDVRFKRRLQRRKARF